MKRHEMSYGFNLFQQLTEKIDKTKSVWMITGTPLNPLDASVSTKCNILPKKKSEKEK